MSGNEDEDFTINTTTNSSNLLKKKFIEQKKTNYGVDKTRKVLNKTITKNVETVLEKNFKTPEKVDEIKKEVKKTFNKASSFNGEQRSKTTKQAKFSSLFKNNHEIPKVGDIEAKNLVKEGLFSLNSFSNLNLAPHITDTLEKRFDLSTMTQIQEKSIPAILASKDCFVKSQTGSGKTLAYAIPVVQRLQERLPRIKRTDGIFALVLVPTRELAIQTCQVFEKLCNACVWVVAGCLIGGMKKKAEKDRIRRGLNILVATPGRLCDHLDTTQALDLSKLEFLIFDEADRMLDLEFEKKINFIIFKIHQAKKKQIAEPEMPKFKLDENGEPVEVEAVANPSPAAPKRIDPQTILISATLSSGIKEIARRLNVSDPVVIDAAYSQDKALRPTHNTAEIESGNNEVEKIALPSKLSHFYVSVPSKLRLIGLISFILEKFVHNNAKSKSSKVIIFASTNDSVQFHENILSTFLNRKFNMYSDDDDYEHTKGGEYNYDELDEYDSDLENMKRMSKRKISQKAETSSMDLIKNKKNYVCDIFSLYGNMDQHKRTEILAKFCKAKSGVLISTDVAARGLDMPNIDWIVQYNTPGSCVDYIHRVGRTARVGHRGNAIIFLEPCEIDYLKELNKFEIALREIKLDSMMSCLNEESKYYPRQVNSDRLAFPRNSEECANSMQFYIEEYVEKMAEMQTLARKAYISFLRSYTCYTKEWKVIFNIKNLHIGHVAKSFGLREAPKEIAGRELKLFKGSKEYQQNKGNYNGAGEKRDKFESKQARDMKRLSNNHREYGNVAKKNKLKSQKANLDLSGLLRNQKNVSEFASGLETVPPSVKPAISNNRPTRVPKPRIASSDEPKPKIKIPKKNMAIFD